MKFVDSHSRACFLMQVQILVLKEKGVGKNAHLVDLRRASKSADQQLTQHTAQCQVSLESADQKVSLDSAITKYHNKAPITKVH